ncbi:MAG: tRNA uracil 4-sulfurtransferase ThiI [Pseudohongiella sp.]|nr:tRNA uracil 4-sulfurtransferase ThiI [Pseudohongiella sp.]
MLYLIRFHPEIIIKTRPVRHRLIQGLRRNLRIILKRLDAAVSVTGDWDILEVQTPDGNKILEQQVEDVLLRTPGISLVMPVKKLPFVDLDQAAAETLKLWAGPLRGRTFAVRCKRQGDHAFTSTQVERQIGAVLLHNSEAAGVNLNEPDVTVRVEIRFRDLYIVERQLRGLGGYPMGTQEPVLSLISGGFDSAVASYLCMKRGIRTHFLFFNLGGREHEIAVKEVALYLWMKFGSSHRVKFISVPFEPVLQNILQQVDTGHMGVVLKRAMMRAAERIAADMRVGALVTGESVGQVASQTLPNLALIDAATTRLVLRPLIVSDKQDIINIARQIGTEVFNACVPEYCGAISVKPTTNARLARVEEEEAKLSFALMDEALVHTEVQMIDRVVDVVDHKDVTPLVYTEVPAGAIVIDVRHPDEQTLLPLELAGVEVRAVPFFQISSQFAALDRQFTYLLYCEKGMMSRLHASHLKEAGYTNVAVYRP